MNKKLYKIKKKIRASILLFLQNYTNSFFLSLNKLTNLLSCQMNRKGYCRLRIQ